MIKYITLIALLLPFPALSHDWDQHQWLDTLLTNHITVGDCWKTLNDGDTVTFREKCSPTIMGHIEDKVMAEYHIARAVHPNISDIEFFELHFGDSGEYSDEDIVAIWGNVMAVDRVVALLAGMHIAEGLTRGDK